MELLFFKKLDEKNRILGVWLKDGFVYEVTGTLNPAKYQKSEMEHLQEIKNSPPNVDGDFFSEPRKGVPYDDWMRFNGYTEQDRVLWKLKFQ